MSRIFSWTIIASPRTIRAVLVGPTTLARDVTHPRSWRPATFGTACFLLVLLAFALTGCGSGGGAQSAGSSAGYDPQEEGLAAPSGVGGEAASAGAASSSAHAEEGVPDGVEASLPGLDGEKIVKTADLGMRAEDVRESASRAQEIAARFGGSVASSRIDGGDGAVTADLVLSVPSAEFEAALDDLRGLGEVTTDTVGGEDVTEEFVDLRSRERNLLAAEESLLRLYDKAESVDDAISIERELTDLRGQIEVVQGRIQYLEERTSTSRISLAIEPLQKLAESRPSLEPARAVSTAWNASLNFLGTVAGAAISVLVFGWWLVPALVVAAVWWRRRPRHADPAGGP
ncbi:MAG: DUF4349 domain-containing protein [Actinomycetota bacterium]|nr:DUF4349 domain-containing protein [Actinomycetota bacterium]